MEFNELENDWFEYIPEWNDNKSLDPENQISCQIRYMLQEDIDKFADEIAVDDRGKGKKGKTKFTKNYRALINKNVKDIKNLFEKKKDGDRIELKTIQEVSKRTYLKGLYEDIGEAIDASNCLEELEIKNL